MQLLSPTNFSDYELLDCGDFEKLERFGKYISIRPEPQAVWPKIYSNSNGKKWLILNLYQNHLVAANGKIQNNA